MDEIIKLYDMIVNLEKYITKTLLTLNYVTEFKEQEDKKNKIFVELTKALWGFDKARCGVMSISPNATFDKKMPKVTIEKDKETIEEDFLICIGALIYKADDIDEYILKIYSDIFKNNAIMVSAIEEIKANIDEAKFHLEEVLKEK